MLDFADDFFQASVDSFLRHVITSGHNANTMQRWHVKHRRHRESGIVDSDTEHKM